MDHDRGTDRTHSQEDRVGVNSDKAVEAGRQQGGVDDVEHQREPTQTHADSGE